MRLIFSIIPVALGPAVYSVSNRNQYQQQKSNNASGEQSAAGSYGSQNLAAICEPIVYSVGSLTPHCYGDSFGYNQVFIFGCKVSRRFGRTCRLHLPVAHCLFHVASALKWDNAFH
jgi:hypothetical protein